MTPELPTEDHPAPHRALLSSILLGLAAVLFCALRWWLPLHDKVLESGQLKADSVRAGLAVLAVAAFLWLTEALPIAATALLIPLLAVFAAGTTVELAFAPFADPIIFLFFGGFVLAGAMSAHGLDRWAALRAIRFSRGNFTLAGLLLIVLTAVISMWISNTATAAMMLPLGLGLARQIDAGPSERRRAEIFLLIGIAYAASIGGIGTLVGTPPNAIAAKVLGMDFTGWMRYGLPAFGVMLPLLLALLLVVFRPSFRWKVHADAGAFAWTAQRRLTLAIFLLTVGAWFASVPLGKALGVARGFDTVIAVAAAVALCLLRLLPWRELERSVDWGVLLLFGGGLALGKVLEDTGASIFLARGFTHATEGWSFAALILTLCTTVVLLSEFASNTAVATLMAPIFARVAVEMHLPPEKLVIPVGLAASCGFMLPVATPPNALVYGTGLIPQRSMIRAGLGLDILCILAIAGLAVWVF